MCQYSTMNMIHEVPPDIFYADPGFIHPENVHSYRSRTVLSTTSSM
jgi:EAL domain-containing protein (putative c-di-GMP-specific phosphodiesterase class I)